MKTIKCVLSVIMGFFLGLLSSCGRNAPEKKKPEEPSTVPGTEKKEKEPDKPKKGEELPIRKPILE